MKQEAAGRPVYFISNRPESYEHEKEVTFERAGRLARIIAEHAAREFPGIDFCIDGKWHNHDPRAAPVMTFIESHWQSWEESDQASPGASSAPTRPQDWECSGNRPEPEPSHAEEAQLSIGTGVE